MTQTATVEAPLSENASATLTPAKIVTLAAFATFVWFCAAMFIRYVGPTGQFQGWKVALLYVLTIPGTVLLNERTRKLVRLPRRMMVPVIAVTTATATMLDGVAMSGFPELYGADPVVMLGGAVWLLWAIGVAAALSLIAAAREGNRS
jgi:hypothetical protein